MTTFLETKRLVIKSPTPEDFSVWCILHAESDVMVYSPEIIQEWLSHHILEFQLYGFSMGSVFLKDSQEFIGRAGLFHSPDAYDHEPVIEMGYIIHKQHQGKGYATEIANALIGWAFSDLNINKIIALTRLDNKKSQHVLEKVGMRYIKQVQSEGSEFLLYEIDRI